ncbi:MAG: hypothetical protein DDT19_00537 [Syntrophomonadaceae bacterium]|nr:hypothetical protein [Bacillota bacterium]
MPLLWLFTSCKGIYKRKERAFPLPAKTGSLHALFSMTTEFELFLFIHLLIFLLVICLSLLLVKLRDGTRVTVSYLLIWAATPLFNVFLLGLLVYESVIIFLDWRRNCYR